MSNKIRVLIVDDHEIVSRGLAVLLECNPDITVVGQASNGKEAIALFRQHQPDVTLMDLRMPEMDGVKAIATLCSEFPDPRIIVLTTHDGDEDIYRGLRAGAKGYLLKGSKPDELLSAIYTVHGGKQHIPSEVAAKLLERMSNPELSDRELEVLRHMANGMNNQEIGTALNVTESTIKFHINRILSKLGVSDRTQAVLVALKRGLADL
jgi:two-component system, NarL family, response regulator